MYKMATCLMVIMTYLVKGAPSSVQSPPAGPMAFLRAPPAGPMAFLRAPPAGPMAFLRAAA